MGNVDLNDFFTSIHLGRISNALQKPPYSLAEKAAIVIAQICCDENGILPQGAPSSPILSNVICRELDEQLQQVARRHGCRYTRYADDITISTSRPTLPIELFSIEPLTGKAIVGPAPSHVITSAGFSLNSYKVRIAWSERKQEVTGLTINERTNLGRWFVRELDSLIYIWQKYGPMAAAARYARRHRIPATLANPKRVLNFLRGKCSFLKMVKGEHDPVCRRLQWDLADLPDSAVPPPVSVSCLPAMPLYGLRGRFHGWQTVVNQYKESVKFLEVRAGPDLHNGSAFIVGSDTAISAGHNIAAGPVRLYDGDQILYPSRVWYIDVRGSRDIALLMFNGHPFRKLPPFHFQYRLPEIGEDVAAIGYPQVGYRHPDTVLHIGAVEALPKSLARTRFIQTSFQSGGGLSGGPLVDRRGAVLGLMVENAYMEVAEDDSGKRQAPPRPYGQAIPYEYVARARTLLRRRGDSALIESGFELVEWLSTPEDFAK